MSTGNSENISKDLALLDLRERLETAELTIQLLKTSVDRLMARQCGFLDQVSVAVSWDDAVESLRQEAKRKNDQG